MRAIQRISTKISQRTATAEKLEAQFMYKDKPQITISPLYHRDLKAPLPVQNAFSCENKHRLDNPVNLSNFNLQISNLSSVQDIKRLTTEF